MVFPLDAIALGTLYKIDPAELNENHPVHLRHTRVVLVKEMTDLGVTMMYARMHALRTYIRSGAYISRPLPRFDRSCVINWDVAVRLIVGLYIANNDEPNEFVLCWLQVAARMGSCWAHNLFTWPENKRKDRGGRRHRREFRNIYEIFESLDSKEMTWGRYI